MGKGLTVEYAYRFSENKAAIGMRMASLVCHMRLSDFFLSTLNDTTCL